MGAGAHDDANAMKCSITRCWYVMRCQYDAAKPRPHRSGQGEQQNLVRCVQFFSGNVLTQAGMRCYLHERLRHLMSR